ncbi:hypothetical protein SLS62_004893 [Diatrype stigma]|uniref:Uncharacterized protein n=1 Tax=Diatrype stigma TaxID=117547 RepID=A0AAN9UVU8_9PEZI
MAACVIADPRSTTTVTYLIASLIFMSPSKGYIRYNYPPALLDDWMHHAAGQRGVGFVFSVSQLAACGVNAAHPSHPVLVAGVMVRSGGILGFGHALYGLEARCRPPLEDAFNGSMTNTGLWLDIAIGRFMLGFVILPPKPGEKRAKTGRSSGVPDVHVGYVQMFRISTYWQQRCGHPVFRRDRHRTGGVVLGLLTAILQI